MTDNFIQESRTQLPPAHTHSSGGQSTGHSAVVYLSLASHSAHALGDVLCGFLLSLGSLVVLHHRFLSHGLLGFFGSTDSLLTLGLTDLWLLIPLGHDILKCCSHHRTLELLGTAGPFLGHILLKTLLVLPTVENGPGDVPWVPLKHVGLVGSGGQELVALAISLDPC